MAKLEKIYPPTVTLRKSIALVAIVIVAAIVFIIFYNIRASSQRQQNAITTVVGKNSVKINAALPGNLWYENQAVRKTATAMESAAAKIVAITNGAVRKVAEPTARVDGVTSRNQSPSLEDEEELKKIMHAPIGSNQIVAEVSNNGAVGNSAPISSAAAVAAFSASPSHSASTMQQTITDDQNGQSAKRDFLKSSAQSNETVYLHETLTKPLSPYELKAGAVIPAILITGINSDLPGQITAQVRANVYDTIAGKYVVIPQGAKLTGIYDAQIVYGQKRVLIVWQRVIFPNGQSVNLEGMPGVDMSGYAGFSDKVDNHYFKIFGSVILMSAISAGAQLSQPPQTGDNSVPSINQTLAASLGTNIMNTTNSLTQKNLSIQPTLIIRPGYLFNVSVTKDIIFPGEYSEAIQY